MAKTLSKRDLRQGPTAEEFENKDWTLVIENVSLLVLRYP